MLRKQTNNGSDLMVRSVHVKKGGIVCIAPNYKSKFTKAIFSQGKDLNRELKI